MADKNRCIEQNKDLRQKYKTIKQLDTAVDVYFSEKVIIQDKTVAGLCLHLGFESKDIFLNVDKYGQQYKEVLKRAKLKMEKYYEEKLIGNRVTGSIFALKNLGWSDKDKDDTKTQNTQVIIVKFGDDEKKKVKVKKVKNKEINNIIKKELE